MLLEKSRGEGGVVGAIEEDPVLFLNEDDYTACHFAALYCCSNASKGW